MEHEVKDLCTAVTQHSEQYWTLLGVVVGALLSFLTGQVSHFISERRQFKRNIRILNEELRVIRAQIPQKLDIIDQMFNSVRSKQVLPGDSVKFPRIGYDHVMPSLYWRLSSKQRASLHVIYERLRLVDQYLTGYEDRLYSAVKDKVIFNPWAMCESQLKDTRESCELAMKVIDSYLAGEPLDVFYQDEAK